VAIKELKEKCSKHYFKLALITIGIFISIFTFNEMIGSDDRAIKLQPYLQAVTHNSIYILVETNDDNPVYAEYKNATNSREIVKSSFFVETEKKRNPTYVHRIKLDSLETNTSYTYRVFTDKDTTVYYNFYTAALPGTSYRFAVTGDMRSNPDIFKNVCRNIINYSPRFSIYTGDLCYNPEYYSWKEEFLIPQHMELIAEVPFFNAIGNHEKWKKNTEAFQQAPESSSGHQAYYSFDYGDVHFLILSTEHGVGRNSSQWNFAVEDLKKNNSRWTIAVFHIPAYSGGGHGENKNMIRMTREVFEPYGVDFIFNGHSHFYQHNRVNGIRHFILAGGGAPLYSPEKKDYTIKMKKSHHFAICDVTPDEFKMMVYDLKGNTIDSIVTKYKAK
jgi:acid phosphatase type 7